VKWQLLHLQRWFQIWMPSTLTGVQSLCIIYSHRTYDLVYCYRWVAGPLIWFTIIAVIALVVFGKNILSTCIAFCVAYKKFHSCPCINFFICAFVFLSFILVFFYLFIQPSIHPSIHPFILCFYLSTRYVLVFLQVQNAEWFWYKQEIWA
jgi:hypothetical protein